MTEWWTLAQRASADARSCKETGIMPNAVVDIHIPDGGFAWTVAQMP